MVSRSGWWVLGLLLVSVTAFRDTPAHAGDEAWASAVIELASEDPAHRAAAAARLGREGGEGERLAMVLGELAVGDPDAKVREAASGSLHALAARGLGVFAKNLQTMQSSKDAEFLRTADALTSMAGAMHHAAHFLSHPKAPESARVAVMRAMPLACAIRLTGHTDDQQGLDLLLLDEAVRGPAQSRPLALAALAIWGCASARDAGLTPPTTGKDAADAVSALIRMLQDPTSPFANIALALLGAAAPATPEVTQAVTAALLARLPQAGSNTTSAAATDLDRRVIATEAVRRLGPAALGATEGVRKALELGSPGATRALLRLGVRTELTPEPSAKTATRAVRDLDAGETQVGYVREYLRSVEEVAWTDEALARQFASYVIGIAWTAADQPGRSREASLIWREALYVRALLGPVKAGEETKHLEFFTTSKDSARKFAGRLLKAALGMEGGAILEAIPAPEEEPESDPLLDPFPESQPDPTFDPLAVRLEDLHAGALRLAARRVARDGGLPPRFLLDQPADSPAVLGALEGLTQAPKASASQLEGLLHVLSWTDGPAASLRSKGVAAAMQDIVVANGQIRAKVLDAMLARRLTIRAISAAGPAGAAALPRLDALRADADPMLRWEVERARHAIQMK